MSNGDLQAYKDELHCSLPALLSLSDSPSVMSTVIQTSSPQNQKN